MRIRRFTASGKRQSTTTSLTRTGGSSSAAIIIIRQKFSQLLPVEIQKEIDIGLVHAAKGALRRNVTPEYTNISIMSAFLMDYVGTEFKIDELKTAGLQKAKAIYSLYKSHKTFSEYNSPT